MALSNATLSNGATISVTGGTTLNFAPSGTDVPDGVEIINTDEADFRIRKRISLRAKMPTYNASTNTYTKGKRMVTFTYPKILADGTVSFRIARLEVEEHPEVSAADQLALRKEVAQVLIDSDFTAFFDTGSKA